jgi:hypothetical protein
MKFILAAFLFTLFWASTTYVIPESSNFSLNNVTAMLSSSARTASEMVDGFLSPAQARTRPPPVRSHSKESRRH